MKQTEEDRVEGTVVPAALPRDRDEPAPASSDERVVRALHEYGAELEKGHKPDRAKFLAGYPEIAAELAECLEGLEFVQVAARQLSETGSCSVSQRLAAGELQPEAPLGDFRIVREIGRGGMGVVYEAVQLSLGRRVALKVLPFASTFDRKQLQRFQNEAQAAAQLHHTNIVPVFGTGQERGVHYYAMQFIEGRTLSVVISERQGLCAPDPAAEPAAPHEPTTPVGAHSTELSAPDPAFFRTVARLGIQAAEGLDHAHQLGIVHRDIKPSNLLVDARGNLWITDFGLAHCQSHAGLTMTGDLVGTLRYMSPEQALAKRVLVDQRTDVYSLGATLYELLTLHPAVAGNDRQELLRHIAFEDPRPPRQLNKAIPPELELIVLKTMEKNPADRYSTAQELADDLRRFLEDKPIRAQRPTLVQRTRKWIRRRPAVAAFLAMTGVALLALALLFVGYRYYEDLQEAYDRESKARQDLVDAHARLELKSYHHGVALASIEWRDLHPARARQYLDACPPHLRHWEWHYLKRVCEPEVTLTEHRRPIEGMAYSPDGKYLASADTSGLIALYDANAERPLYSFTAKLAALGLTFTPDSKHLVYGEGEHIKIWDIDRRRELASMVAHEKYIYSLMFSRNGKRVVSVDLGGVCKVWNTPDVKDPRSWSVVLQDPNVKVNDVKTPALLSGDGERLVSINPNKPDLAVMELREVATGKLLLQSRRGGGEIVSLAYSPDDKYVASGWTDGLIDVVGVSAGRDFGVIVHRLSRHTGAVNAVAYSPDGKRLASGGADQMVTLWDAVHDPRGLAGDTEELWRYRGHAAAVVGVAFSPDGKRLVSADTARSVKIWNPAFCPEGLPLRGHPEVRGMAFAQHPDQFLTAGSDETIKLWDLKAHRVVRTIPLGCDTSTRSAFSPDGRFFAAAVREKPLDSPFKIWDTATGDVVQELRGHTNSPFCVAFSPDNRLLATSSFDRTIRVWNIATGQELWRLGKPHSAAPHLEGMPGPIIGLGLAFSSEGSLLASTAPGHAIRLSDTATGSEVRILHGHTKDIFSLTFDPTGKRMASSSADGTVRVWDVANGRLLLTLDAHLEDGARHAAFSPDGKRLVSVGYDHSIKVWDATNGDNPLSLRGQTIYDNKIPTVGVIFSGDAWRFATAFKDTVKVWDARPAR